MRKRGNKRGGVVYRVGSENILLDGFVAGIFEDRV